MIPVYELRFYDWIGELMKLPVKGKIIKNEKDLQYLSKGSYEIGIDLNKLFYLGEVPFKAGSNFSNIIITRYANKFNSYWDATSDLRRGGISSRRQYFTSNTKQKDRIRKSLIDKGYKKWENYEESDINFAAEDSAKNTLFHRLTEENRAKYENGYLEVPSGLFDDIYYYIPIIGRIRVYKRGYDEYMTDRPVVMIGDFWWRRRIYFELCIIIDEDLPVHDILLTKFLYISYDEENTLRTGKHIYMEDMEDNLLTRLEANVSYEKKFRKLFDLLSIEDFDYADIRESDFSNVKSNKILRLLEETIKTKKEDRLSNS